ncbi:ATP-binding protein [Nocardioides sp. J54]|uniref:ATP-binding protein n=1 Tax=Nocardioides sp. J54 TaxID=935866 RepID=UPI0012FBC5D9|nr:hypothetical protein [Nocardioides sp. J54]
MGDLRGVGAHRLSGRSFGASVERGLHLSIGLVILCKTLVFGAQLATQESWDAVELASAALIILCVGTAALRCLGPGPSNLDVLSCTLAMVVGATMPHETVPLSGAADSPVVHLVEPMLLVIAVHHRRPVLPILLLGGLFVALRWDAGGSDGLHYGLQEAVLVCGTAFGALYLVTQMRRASARAEALIASHREAHRAHLSAAEVETTAFLHDDLVPTLLAVGSLPHAPETRTAAGAALSRLAGPAHGEDAGDVVTALRNAAARELVDVELVVRGPRTHLPEAVREAVVGAAVEAMRNVLRHSGQRRATVTVVRRPTAIRVRIEDEGKGFSGRQGVGIRVAITGRLESVGGTATVSAREGGGTVVELAWRGRLLSRLLGLAPDHDRLIRAAVSDPGRVARQACLVLACGYLATAALLTLDTPLQPWSYGGAAVIAATTLLLTQAISRGPLHPLVLLAVAALPAGVLAVVLPTVSPEGIGGAESWMIEFSALPVLAAAWVVSVRTVVALLVPNGVVVALLATEAGVPLADLPHLLFVQPLSALFVAVIVAVCRRAGRVLTQPAASESVAWAKAVRVALGPTLRPVVQALRSVADGTAEPGPGPALLAQAVRDCLYLPGPEHEAMRAELDALRRTGAQVDTIMPEPPPATRTLATALGTVRRFGPDHVTVSGTGDEAMVVVMPGPPAEVVERLPRQLPVAWSVDADEEVCLITGPPDLATLIRRGPLAAAGVGAGYSSR